LILQDIYTSVAEAAKIAAASPLYAVGEGIEPGSSGVTLLLRPRRRCSDGEPVHGHGFAEVVFAGKVLDAEAFSV